MALDTAVMRSPRPEPLAHLGLASLALLRNDLDAAALSLAAARAAWGGSTPPASWYHYAGLEAAIEDLDHSIRVSVWERVE